MKRWAITVAMALAPFLIYVFLESLSLIDYEHCMYESDGSTLPPTSLAENLHEFLSVLEERAKRNLHYLALIFFSPFLWLAAMSHWQDRQQKSTVALWFGLLGFMIWMMLPPSSLHDCDRKGVDTLGVMFLLLIVGFVLCVIHAIWSAIPRGAPK